MKPPNILTDALQTAKPVFIYIGVFSFFINFLLLLMPLYSLQVLDRVLSTGSLQTLFWLSVIMIIAFVSAGVLQALRSFVLIKIGDWIDKNLSTPLLSISLEYAANNGTRGTQNLRDLNTIKGFLTGNGLIAFFDAPWSIISLLILFMIDADLGVITFLGCILLLGLAWLNELSMRKLLNNANETSVKNFAQVDIAMRNAEAIEAMGMTHIFAQYWQKINYKVTALQNLASYRSAIVQALSKISRLTLQIAITGWGAYLALHNEITYGSIIAASILAGKALTPFDTAISSWKSLIDVRKSYERLNEALASMSERITSLSLPAPQGFLTVDKISHSVAGRSKPILKNISFAILPGDALGIIGPSAAGKSTLAKLCVGTSKPDDGVVRLDGGDVSQWNRKEFGQYVGYLPQNIELFSGTVKDNIARMNSNVSDEMILKAAQMAYAHDFIMMLPNGYNTDIGTGGVALSAGQRQRVALARAFFGTPKLVVMDEPDANLDAEGEEALARSIKNARTNNITTLVITHRRKLLSNVNKLLVLKEGEVMLFGDTQDVINNLTQQLNETNNAKITAQKEPNYNIA